MMELEKDGGFALELDLLMRDWTRRASRERRRVRSCWGVRDGEVRESRWWRGKVTGVESSFCRCSGLEPVSVWKMGGVERGWDGREAGMRIWYSVAVAVVSMERRRRVVDLRVGSIFREWMFELREREWSI